MPTQVFGLHVMAAVAVTLMSAPALAQQAPDAQFRTTTLTLSAQAEINVKPDKLTLTLGVAGEAATAQLASAQTAGRVDAVVKALLRAGVAQRDIQTKYASLQPVYSDSSNRPRDIVAYRADTTVSVTMRDLDRAGAIMDLGIAAGANQVQGLQFGVTDSSQVQRQARDAALKSLQHDADEIAAVMGQRVVRLVSINTQAYPGAVPAFERGVEEIVVTGSRIDAGQLAIRGSANGVFELAPR